VRTDGGAVWEVADATGCIAALITSRTLPPSCRNILWMSGGCLVVRRRSFEIQSRMEVVSCA